MAVDSESSAVRGQVVSDTPGRLRVRVHPSARHTTVMHRLQARLEDKPGVDTVEANSGTGSLLVRYDATRCTSDELLDTLHDAGLVLHDILTAKTPELPAAGHSETSVDIINTFDRLDRELARLTGRKMDVKLLVPMTVGAVGLFKVMRSGLQFADIPGYILLWYAFDMFYKFHTVPPGATPPASDGSTSTSETSQSGG